MKLPLLPVHIILTKTLKRRDEETKTETRQMSNKLVGSLLWRNAVLEEKLRYAK